MTNYTYTFATSGDVQTAHTNGELGNPYVAYITSTSGIDWNSLNIPQPSYIGEWSSDELNVYTFTVLDDSPSLWTNDVLIGTINCWYARSDSEIYNGDVNIYLSQSSDDWSFNFISQDGRYSETVNVVDGESEGGETTNMSVVESDDKSSSTWSPLHITLQEHFTIYGKDYAPLNLTTINPTA